MDAEVQVSSNMAKVPWARFAGVIAALAILFGAVAIGYSRRFHLGFGTTIGIYGCFLLLLSLGLLPGTQAGRTLTGKVQTMWAFCALLCIPYMLYAWGTGDFRLAAVLRIASVACLPAILYRTIPPADGQRFSQSDLFVAVWMIAVVLGGWLRNVWRVPVNLDFMGRLLLIAVGASAWTFIRPVPGLHYRLQFTRRALKAATLNFLYFAAIAIPAGFLLGFTGWHPRWRGALQFGLEYLEIFLFIALLEEMFFRGFLQSLLSESFGSALKAQFLVSVLFGLFHILHAPFPNWRYVALASVAGWFYGEAYRRGGSLLASALTHATVDTVWRTWFSRT